MYVDASSNGKPPHNDMQRALGELGKHFIGKWSGLGDYFRALDIAGPVVAKQLGAIAGPTILQRAAGIIRPASSPYTAPAPTNIITATRQVVGTVTRLPPPPAINVSSVPIAAPQAAPQTLPVSSGPPSRMPGWERTQDGGWYNTNTQSGGGNGTPPVPVEIGTLDASSGPSLAGLSSSSPILLLIAAAAFFMLDGKPKKRRR